MRRRLLASYLTITALVLVLLVVPLGVTFAGREQDQLETGLERDATVIAGLVEDGLDQSAPVDYEGIAAAYQQRTGARVVIVEASGLSVADTDRPESGTRDFSTRPEFQVALGGDRSTGTRHSETLERDILFVTVPVASGGEVHGAVRVSYPTSELDRRVRDNWLRLGLLSGVVLAVVAIVGLVLARGVSNAVSELERATAALASGDLSRRVRVDRGPQELRSLGTSFNEMADQLDDLVSAQKAFVADASHQLRTPLTALRLRLENAAASAGDDHVRAELEAAVDEANRLSRLVDGLLVLARADRQSPDLVPVELVAVAAERVATWEPLAAEHDLGIHLTAPREVVVRAVDGAVEQMLDNLIDNALDASPAGSQIEVVIDQTAGSTTLHVVDQGVGLDDDERQRAFDRFWRSRTASAGGSGLGLPIVGQLAAQCQARARLEATDGGGIDAQIVFGAGATDRGDG